MTKKSEWKCSECKFDRVWRDADMCPFAYDECDGKKMFEPKEERDLKQSAKL